MAEWVTGTITQVQHWTDKLFSIQLQAPIKPFQAGQFGKLGMDIGDERIQRAYSFVNPPSSDTLEFYLVTVPDGLLSPRLAALQPGDTLLISDEANGFFVLDEVPDSKILWMLATGTALGPYLSMLEEGRDLDRFEHLVLVHAVRHVADLSYLPRMQQLVQRYHGKLRIQPVISREAAAGALQGRVPALIANGALEAAVGLPINAEESHVMLCGNPQMVRDTQQVLKETRAMRKHLRRKPGHVTSEHYW